MQATNSSTNHPGGAQQCPAGKARNSIWHHIKKNGGITFIPTFVFSEILNAY
jgi:hypothetical protein